MKLHNLGDSISDDEDLLTAEIAPKWEEFSDMPSRSLEQVETREEFYNENFENLNMTPTEIKEELLFQDATKALPDQPLPFDRNNFHRTSISARFIQRSKLSSSRYEVKLSCFPSISQRLFFLKKT